MIFFVKIIVNLIKVFFQINDMIQLVHTKSLFSIKGSAYELSHTTTV